MALCLPFVSCESELDIPKKGNQGAEEEYYKTDEHAKSAIALCYRQWTVMFNWLSFTADSLADDTYTGGSDAGDDPADHQLNNYNIGTENERVEYVYSALYELIYYSNLVIEKVGDFNEENPQTDFKTQCLAEAYFFRGFAHFYLAAFWGNAPVVDHLLQPSEYSVSNSADGECMEQAAKDMRKSLEIGHLKSKSGPNDQVAVTYITVEGVKAMLGKVYLYQKKYAESAAMLDEVIKSGKYALYEGEYEDILKYACNWCCENVLEGQAPDDPDYRVAAGFQTYTCIYPGWRLDAIDWSGLDNKFVDDEGDTYYVVKPEWEDINRTGYGFFNPRKCAYDAFVKCEGADGYRTQSVIKTVDFVRDVMMLKLTKPLHGHDVYFNWKQRFLKSDMIYDNGGWNVRTKTTPRWMRYAEVLLNAAEAHYMNNNAGQAKEYVNMVRARAKADAYPSVTMEEIKLERQCELFMEHNRWFDLVRWGDAATVLANQGKVTLNLDVNWQTVEDVSSNPAYGFKAGVHELLPYPNKEILLNPNIKQNPGY